ncbi:MAG: hypothetical protein ACRCXZ_04565 [Patescibacteria group bacterium]
MVIDISYLVRIGAGYSDPQGSEGTYCYLISKIKNTPNSICLVPDHYLEEIRTQFYALNATNRFLITSENSLSYEIAFFLSGLACFFEENELDLAKKILSGQKEFQLS